jgi:ABC-2 type transport system permease protein
MQRRAEQLLGAGTVASVKALVRSRARQVRNALDLQLRVAPARTFLILVALFGIWASLYVVLERVFLNIGRLDLIAVVANKHIFAHFFLVLAVMLAFSNAILAFGYLFGREEAAHLLAMPVQPRQVVLVKWLEGLLLSSWSLFLLGVPLMLAVAKHTSVEWYYYPLFIGHFMGFVIIPATLGVLAAWAVAMWIPRKPLLLIIWGLLIAAALGIWHFWNISQAGLATEEWIKLVARELSLAQSRLLPSTWSAAGIVAAIERRVGDSLVYLLTVLGNAAFVVWLVVNLVGAGWSEAYSRARHSYLPPGVRRGWMTAGLCRVLFFYLPAQLRVVLLKDIRGLVRDATQWTQMAIILGLLVIYSFNLRQLPVDLENPSVKVLFTFLNLTVITLILATLTSRFVYPLLSLEMQQLWLLGLLPTSRTTLLLCKFLFSLTVTGIAGVGVMTVSVLMLDLPANWVQLNIFLCAGMCCGLSGLSVGLGARFPVLGQRNPARIASGLGGTLNLVASVTYVMIQLVVIAAVVISEYRTADSFFLLPTELSLRTWQVAGGLLLFSGVTAAAALWLGARHFERLEF